MFKKITLLMMILSLLIVGTPFSTTAASTNPVITSPVLYEEVKTYTTASIKWTAPSSGTVSKYIISVRELRFEREATNTLILNAHETTASARSVTLSSGKIRPEGYYRASVCAVMSDGTKRWSNEQYFYGAFGKGIKPYKTIEFKVWEGFMGATKQAIANSAAVWDIALYTTTPITVTGETSTLNWYIGDGINMVNTVTGSAWDNTLMTTYVGYNSNGYIVEADISIEVTKPWGNSQSPDFFDIQNVMTHEMGHVIGITDRYMGDDDNNGDSNALCEWTMYGISEKNEIKKRTLHSQDITNLTQLSNSI